jgi:hypothetical protein
LVQLITPPTAGRLADMRVPLLSPYLTVPAHAQLSPSLAQMVSVVTSSVVVGASTIFVVSASIVEAVLAEFGTVTVVVPITVVVEVIAAVVVGESTILLVPSSAFEVVLAESGTVVDEVIAEVVVQ